MIAMAVPLLATLLAFSDADDADAPDPPVQDPRDTTKEIRRDIPRRREEGSVNYLPLTSDSQLERMHAQRELRAPRAEYRPYGYGPYGYGNIYGGRQYYGTGYGPYGGNYIFSPNSTVPESTPMVGGYGYGYPDLYFRPRSYRGLFPRGGYGISDDFGNP